MTTLAVVTLTRPESMQVAEVEGVLYAMGGNDGSSSLNSVEVPPMQ